MQTLDRRREVALTALPVAPNSHDGQSAYGPKVENADFEVVDEEKK